MTTGRLLSRFLLYSMTMLVLGLSSMKAMAQTDPPARIARLNHSEGAVTYSPAGDNEWIDAELNRPLTRGDKLWTDKGSRAEVQVGSSAVRLDGGTQLEILALDDQSAQLSLTQGTLYVRVRSLPEGENFEIDTPNLAYRAAYPGDYRIDVDATRGTTRVTIHSGTGAVYGEAGQSLPLGGGQQITFRARSLAQLAAQESPPQDNFDRWAAERNRREDQSVSARFVPREVVGYQSLDAHGQWTQNPTHGAVWFPQGTPANWAPYRHGRWEWIGPWGWTWIDDAPWGFAPSHYGRWTQIDSRWAWVPGRLGLRPVYAPALVAFVGGGSTGAAWNIPVAAGRPGVAWFPLAPGEAWQPGYRATPLYISSVNRNMSPQPVPNHAHQGRPEALTAISTEDFHRGRPVRGSWLRVAANALTKAQIVPPPPMPEGRALAARERPATARATPPAQPDIRQVAITPPAQQTTGVQQPQQPQQTTQAQAQAQAQRDAEAKVRQQAKAAEQAALAQQAQLAQQAREAAQAKAAEQAKATEQRKEQQAAEQRRAAQEAKLAEQAKAAEQAKLAAAQQAKAAERQAQQDRVAEQARLARAEQARRAELVKAELATRKERQAKQGEAARREQMAQRAETLKREQVAKRTEQARRAEQARKVAQAKRDAYAARQEEKAEKARRETHAQRVEMARRAAERDAEALRQQRETARREGLEREQAQRETWERQQQALSEQWRRDHQAWEQQQRERTRQRPDLRNDRRAPPAEVWQRGIPILNPGRTS